MNDLHFRLGIRIRVGRPQFCEGYVVADVAAPIGPALIRWIFNQDRGALRDPVDAPSQPLSPVVELHAAANGDPEQCGTLGAGYEPMGVGPVAKQPVGDALKATSGAMAFVPAQPLREVHEFVFEKPLERVEPVAAGQSADRHLGITPPRNCQRGSRWPQRSRTGWSHREPASVSSCRPRASFAWTDGRSARPAREVFRSGRPGTGRRRQRTEAKGRRDESP